MIQVMTKVSSGNQITLPSTLRKAFNLGVGDEVTLEERADGILLKKALTREEKIKKVFADLDEWRDGFSDETKELVKKHAGWTVNQYHEYYDNLPGAKAYMREKYGV